MEQPEVEEPTGSVKPIRPLAFKKYNEITNIESSQNISPIVNEGFTSDKYEWVMTEKVHGANFSIITDGVNFLCAKRSGIISSVEKFHGYEKVVEKIKDKLIFAVNLLKREFPDFIECTFFGEIFGGLYPHPEVKSIPGVNHVQKGVYYSPDVHIYMFDIFVKNHHYLDYDLFERIMKESELLYSVALQRGKFYELAKFDVETFYTTLPSFFGLPPINLTKSKNIAEGVVLKPVKNCYTSKGRVLVKYKSEAFKEVSGVKGITTKKNKKPNVKTQTEFNPTELEILEDMKRYCTENRLRNVLSKVGAVKGADKAKITGFLIRDIIKDFSADSTLLLTIAKDKQKKLLNAIKPKASKLVEKNWDKILQNEF